MRKLNSTFNKKMFKLTISDFTKSINFAIDKIKAVETALNELLIFIITMSEHNNITFLDYKYITLFIYNAVNNQIEFDYFRIIKHISLNVNYYKDIVSFIEPYEKKLNKIRFRQ